MWNALAGYAGLVSVGQQVFFGIGAYATIRLSCCRNARLPALLAGRVAAGSARHRRFRSSCCACVAANSPSRTWVIAESLHLMVNFDPLIQGETGESMISLNAYDPCRAPRASTTGRRSASMLALLGAIFVLLRSHSGPRCRRSATTKRPRLRSASGLSPPSGPYSSWRRSALGSLACSGSRPRSPFSRAPISACNGPPT